MNKQTKQYVIIFNEVNFLVSNFNFNIQVNMTVYKYMA